MTTTKTEYIVISKASGEEIAVYDTLAEVRAFVGVVGADVKLVERNIITCVSETEVKL